MYQTGIALFQELVREPQRVHVSGRKRLHQHIRLSEQVGGECPPVIRFYVQRDTALVAVQVDEHPARLQIGPVIRERTQESRIVSDWGVRL